MQKIIQAQTHSKTQDMQRDYYLNQKKTLEINPRHPLIKELLRRVEDNPADKSAKDMAVMMFNTATLRWDRKNMSPNKYDIFNVLQVWLSP